MDAILFVFVWLCYLGLSLWLARIFNRWARGEKHRFRYPGGIVVLVMWLPVLWDAPLQEMKYRKLCREEAGLTVFKTPEQWDYENGGALRYLSPVKDVKIVTVSEENYRIYMNERIYYDIFNIPRGYGLIERRSDVVDGETNQVMLRHVDFDAGPLHHIPKFGRIWMNKPSCRSKDDDFGKSPFLGMDLKFKGGLK